MLLSKMGPYSDMTVLLLPNQRTDTSGKKKNPRNGVKYVFCTRASPLPVTPSSKYSSEEDKQERQIREPHDDIHGIDTKDSPGRRDNRRDGFGATGVGAVLTGAGARTVLQTLGAGVRLIVHGGEARHLHV